MLVSITANNLFYGIWIKRIQTLQDMLSGYYRPF